MVIRTIFFVVCAFSGVCVGFVDRSPPKKRRASDERALPSSVNCTWYTITQPLDHFAQGASPAYFDQRICVYSGYGNNETALFYVGNESPVEEYVNATGLMWSVGEEIGSLLVFAEHRYEGLSVPDVKGLPNCLAYCTVEQALADYAVVADWVKRTFGTKKLVAVGGSYGGMLASWFRIKYPSSVVGAIAGSAPIWGFPLLDSHMDGSSIAVSRSFGKAGGLPTDYCRQNLLGAWTFLAAIDDLEWLAETMNLCSPPASGLDLAQSIQDVFFDLAEANYPFASTYVSSAVGQGQYPLPAWPVRAACDQLSHSPLVQIDGNASLVEFSARVDNLGVQVEWDRIVATSLDGYRASENLTALLKGVAHAFSVWCNVSGTLPCLEPEGCTTGRRRLLSSTDGESDGTCGDTPYHGGSWNPLCCNDNLNLVNYIAQGIGNDRLFWPPNIPRGATLADVLGPDSRDAPGCAPSDAGFPATSDPWSHWMIQQFGDKSAAQQASNIVFSNGLLDPWSAAGVYSSDGIPSTSSVQNISAENGVFSLILDLGAHHLDLMFLTDDDPDCASFARDFETRQIKSWFFP